MDKNKTKQIPSMDTTVHTQVFTDTHIFLNYLNYLTRIK